MTRGRYPTPHETVKRIVSREIPISKVYFDSLLESYDVNVFASNILPKLRATTRVPTTSNIPKEVAACCRRCGNLPGCGSPLGQDKRAGLPEASGLAETANAVESASLALAAAAASAKAAWASSRARIRDTSSPRSEPKSKPLSSRIETSCGSENAFRI